MSDKTYNIVGVSTASKTTKFRVANGDLAARTKVLERNGHTDIKLVQLPAPLGKMEAIEAYKAMNPDAASVRMPNEKPAGTKTVSIKKKAAADVGTAVLADADAEVKS